MPNLFIVIPAYNEERTVADVVRQCQKLSFGPLRNTKAQLYITVIVVDDGSHDHTAQVARAAGALVLRHPINRGLGAALSTGIAAALQLFDKAELLPAAQHESSALSGGGVIVTLDGDGQHDPADIAAVILPILEGKADVVIGSRFFHNPSQPPLILRGGDRSEPPLKVRGGRGSYEMPFARLVANFCGNFFTWFLFGIWVSDSQSGFRAFSGEAAAKLKLRTSTMEVSSEIIREIARLKLRVIEVPITVRYTAYSLSKGQGFLRGLETLWKLIVLRFFR